MMDTTGLRLSLGFVLRHCMNITWTSVQSLWRQPLQASASRSPPVKQHYSTVQHRTVSPPHRRAVLFSSSESGIKPMTEWSLAGAP